MAGHMLRIRALDVQNADHPTLATIWMDLEIGLIEPAAAVGEDDEIPGAEGLEPGEWINATRRLQVQGYTQGFGTTKVERATSRLAAAESLMAVLPMDASPGLVEVDGPYLGIPIGETRFLYARCTRLLPGPILDQGAYQAFSAELLCIDSPPEWQIDPS